MPIENLPSKKYFLFIRLGAVEFKINLGHALSTQFLEQVAKKRKRKKKKATVLCVRPV